MKVLLLAGGFGTRMAEYTESIPKPMVTIAGKPILWHIMQRYAKFGYNEFIIALGYKADVIKEYFVNYSILNSDFMVDLANGQIETFQNNSVDWKITLVDTGQETMTGGRVKRLKNYINDETCLLTYGDGISDIDISKLVNFHKQHGKMVTVTGVHPTARFGEIKIENEQVVSFKEKPQTASGWINGGFFVIEPEFFDLIENDQTILEHEPLEYAAKKGQLMAYCHDGFWQCMDTKRERDQLEVLWNTGNAPWKL